MGASNLGLSVFSGRMKRGVIGRKKDSKTISSKTGLR